MSTLTVTKTYQDSSILYEDDLDNIKTSIETFVNTTGISDDNVQSSTITSAKVDSNTIDVAQINDLAITEGKINTAAITTAKIADSAVTSTKIGNLQVTTAKISDSSVTSGKINNSAATTAKFSSGQVTTDKLGSLAVSTSNISDAAIHTVKKDALNYAKSSATSASTTSTSYTSTGLSTTITTNGNPILIYLESSGTGSNYIQVNTPGGYIGQYAITGYFQIKIDGIVYAQTRIGLVDTSYSSINNYVALGLALPPGAVSYIVQPSAGAHTITVEYRSVASSGIMINGTVSFANIKLVAVEVE